MKIFSLKLLLLFITFAFCMAGCRSAKGVLNDYERNMAAGAYQQLPMEVQELADKKDDTELLWRLLAGTGHYMNANGMEAIEQFDMAEDMMSKNDQTSVFKQGTDTAFAILTNDKAFPYDGGGQDRIFTCLYKAIEYGVQGRQTAARAELNRAMQHQENWLWQRKKEIASAHEELEKAYAAKVAEINTSSMRNQGANKFLANTAFASAIRAQCDFEPAVDGNLEALSTKDYMNTYVQHVCGVFRWLEGTGGRQYLRDVMQLCPENEVLKRDFAEMEAGEMPTNQVWVYVEDGLCPVREEWRVDLPLFLSPYENKYVKYAGMALPYLRYRPAGSAVWRLSAGETSVNMQEFANFDRLMKVEYDVYMRGALIREITRTVLKVSSQVALGIAHDNTNDTDKKFNLCIAQYSALVWAISTTAADLRSWAGLPKKTYVARLIRPDDGRISVQTDCQTFDIDLPQGNSMIFIRKPSAQSPPVIKLFAIKQE